MQKVLIELRILKSFEFVSHLRRASAIVRQVGASSGDIYVKGAPECMKDICRVDSCEYLIHAYKRSTRADCLQKSSSARLRRTS